jgi:UDP-galactopyranose mutase
MILVVGAGLTGATIARELADAGYEVVVVDRREHVAGNAYDYTNEYGIRVHRYGPHLFHTNNRRVWDYLSRFTDWITYEHRVKAQLADGGFVTFPPNAETIEQVGKDNILDVFYRPYSRKMWGKELEELNPDIVNRVPGRTDLEDRYFPNDAYQGLPVNGYTAMVTEMLNHPAINLRLNYTVAKNEYANYGHVFTAESIDEYYDNCYGMLDYRSIRFTNHHLPLSKVFPVGQVNFTNDLKYTRACEWRNFPGHGGDKWTTLTFEEPCDFKDNDYERYYPVNDTTNRDRYNQYRQLHETQNSDVTFVGRCGQYVYIDMHQAVNSALQIATRFIQK